MSKPLLGAVIATILVAVIFIGLSRSSPQQTAVRTGTNVTDTPATIPSAPSTTTLPQLQGDIAFSIGPAGDQGDGVVITNDRGKVGHIKITNADKSTWKDLHCGARSLCSCCFA